MNDSLNSNSARYQTPIRTWMVLFSICLLFGVFIAWATDSYKERLIREVYHDAHVELMANASSLNSTLERKFLLSSGLTAFAETELMKEHQLDGQHFDHFAAALMKSTPGIRNFSLYPGGIARYVYPLKGNEAIIGMNVFNHANEKVRNNAVRTKQITSMTLVGPFELAQGGLGILTQTIHYSEMITSGALPPLSWMSLRFCRRPVCFEIKALTWL